MLVGMACTMAVIFGTRKAIFQQLGKYFCTPVMKSFILQVQGDLLMRNQVAQGRGGEPLKLTSGYYGYTISPIFLVKLTIYFL